MLSKALVAQDLELEMLNVGQGDGFILSCPSGEKILIDLGSKKGKSANMDEVTRRITESISMNGDRFDAIVVTHPDADHYNMLSQALLNIDVSSTNLIFDSDSNDFNLKFDTWAADAFWINPSTLFDNKLAKVTAMPCGNAIVDVLWFAPQHSDKNNQSVSLYIEYGETALFMMGDTHKEVEEQIFDFWKNVKLPKYHVLKVGHHGSESSSGEQFLNWVKPDISLISAGDHSGYKHPRCSVTGTANKPSEQGTLIKYAMKDDDGEHSYVCYDAGGTLRAQDTEKMIFTTLRDGESGHVVLKIPKKGKPTVEL